MRRNASRVCEPTSSPLPVVPAAIPAPIAVSTLDTRLAALSVTDDDFYRTTLYTWTTPAVIGAVRLTHTLLIATTTSGGFACIGSPDEIADQLALVSSIGFTGIGMTSPHYADEAHWYNDEIFPRLEAKGLRSAR